MMTNFDRFVLYFMFGMMLGEYVFMPILKYFFGVDK